MITEVEESLTIPFKFAVLGIGSIARREACLYSDIDLILVLDDNYSHSEREISYFKKFISLLRLMIMGLGEGETNILNHRVQLEKEKNRVGIHIDPSGFFPYVALKRENNRSFGTAKEIITDMKDGRKVMLCDLGSIQDLILLNEKNGYEVFENFLFERNEINSENRNLIIPYIDKLTQFQLLIDHFLEYEKAINVKTISRYVVLLMNRIFMYFGFFNREKISFSETEKKIDILTKFSSSIDSEARKQLLSSVDFIKKYEKMENFIFIFFSEENSKKLKEMFNFLYELRFRCHSFYKEGKDEVFLSPKKDEGRYVLR